MRKICILFFVYLLLLSISTGSASDYGLDISAELIDNYGNRLIFDEEIPIEQNLAIHFTIVNSNDLWINVRTLDLRINAKKDGERFFPSSSLYDAISIQELSIPPKNKADFYVVLEKYNSLLQNDRIGSWILNFETTMTSSSGFNSLDLTKKNYLPLGIIKPNNIEFTVVKENAHLDKNTNFVSNLSYENLDATEKILSALAAFIFIVGIIWSIIRKLKN